MQRVSSSMSKMASAYVPPPPEEDFLGFSTQQEDALSQVLTKSQFGGNGFLGSAIPSSSSHFHSQCSNASTSTLRQGISSFISGARQQLHSEESYSQQVPITPANRQCTQVPMTEDCRLNFSYDAPDEPSGRGHIGLRSVNEIPEMYRSVFKSYSHFNLVQSKVFDDVMYTDSPLVTSAPTGSGKTVIFELAIVRLLVQLGGHLASAKIIYVAPIKALCTERYEDWQAKFGPLGIKCCELTGDSQLDDYFELQNAQIVMTTPEKWDSMTRKWRDHKSLVQLVRLFLIDEVHQLNDETRGPTMEAIVSRMKTIRSSLRWEGQGEQGSELRFIAVSATMPNISDVAAWLGTGEVPALEYAIDDSFRPVRLRKVVLGYPDAASEFKFDLSLNYKLSGVIQCYSDQKPTLVFCATRKGTQQAAGVLIKDARFVMNSHHKQRLVTVANSVKDSKLRDLVLYGVGYHHAGMEVSDRKAIEALFTAGQLPVLFATSTLAMGVNLPAHLVVIKSTMHYISGMFQECSESTVLQMIGRAGRPQFDTTATAVIMTRNSTKMKYEALLGGTQLIESSLHHHLIEHLNAEIVLNTITDVSVALEWLRSTFFHIRVKQNPQHYGLPREQEQKEEKLQQLCLKHLHMLEECGLVRMEDGFTLQPTEIGRLMARYYVAFESMKRFLAFKGKEDLAVLVSELSQCKEFEDVRLRQNERKVLNTLNKDKNRQTIRYPMNGKIKTTDMKVNCLIQANLGCLPVQEFALNQDTQKILRGASRLSKCLMELEMLSNNFECLLNAVLLNKCLHAKLWENSKHVSRQLDKIGLTLSTALVNAGLTSFDKIKQKTPRELELIMNRHPPFGNQVLEAVSRLPSYSLTVDQSSLIQGSQCELTLQVSLTNHEVLKEGGSKSQGHSVVLLVGDMDNKVLCRQRLSNSQLMGTGHFTRKLSVQRSRSGDDLRIHVISMDLVGLDIQEVYTPRYSTCTSAVHRPPPPRVGESVQAVMEPAAVGAVRKSADRSGGGNRKACSHRCINKAVCGHECCKSGVIVKSKPSAVSESTVKQGVQNDRPGPSNPVGAHNSLMQAKTSYMPNTPRIRLTSTSVGNTSQLDRPATSSLTSRFGYTAKPVLSTQRDTAAKHQASFDSYTSYGDNSYSSIDCNTTYSGAHSPRSRAQVYNQDSMYNTHTDLEPTDNTDALGDYSDSLRSSVDMDEWFDSDIAYFTTGEAVVESTPVKKSSTGSKGGTKPKKQSAVSQMRELSQKLQAEAQQVAGPFDQPLMSSGMNKRKRLIDKMFDELLEPKTKSPTTKQPPTSTSGTAAAKSALSHHQHASNWYTPGPLPAKKPRLEDSVSTPVPQPAKKVRIEDPISIDSEMAVLKQGSLSRKLSTQIHQTHNQAAKGDESYLHSHNSRAQFQTSKYALMPGTQVQQSWNPIQKKNKLFSSFNSQTGIHKERLADKKDQNFSSINPQTPVQAVKMDTNSSSTLIQPPHKHTEACAHTLTNESTEEGSLYVPSLYDSEPTVKAKPPAPTSFFTAGPVSNEEEDGDLFSSMFAGIF